VINLTDQFRLDLNKQQELEIDHILEVCRSVYNYALVERKHWLRSRKSPVNSCSIVSEYIIPSEQPYPNYHVQAKNLTRAKQNNQDLKSVNAQVLQQTLKTLDKAFTDMKSQGSGFPRYKKKMRSFVFPAMLTKCLAIGNVKLPQYRFYLKVDKNGTSQECPSCGKHTGKKQLIERVHNCQYCGHTEPRDIASAKVIRNRGLIAVGHTVRENACEVPLIGSDVLAGFEQLTLFELVKCH
jgi:transposase